MERTWRAYPGKSAGQVLIEARLQRELERVLLEKHLRRQREAELQPWMEQARRGLL